MRRTRYLWNIAIPLLVLAIGTAGCSESKKDTGVPSANGGTAAGASARPSASVDTAEQGRKFAQCMRDNGIDMQDPDANGGGGLRSLRGKNIDRDKLNKALEACRSLAPNGGQNPLNDPEQQEKLRVWAQCMRDHGADVPDPDPNNPGSLLGLLLNSADPRFQSAFEACRDKFVQPGGSR
jgi:hypothetical protein